MRSQKEKLLRQRQFKMPAKKVAKPELPEEEHSGISNRTRNAISSR
jgi:hypothetical protein